MSLSSAYKLDLSERMALSKGSVSGNNYTGGNSRSLMSSMTPNASMGYVTEKLYMLLQLYLQNKGFNPSAELLQCFSDLKDNAQLPSAAYLQMLANRLTLDAQGRLILRENGKIVLPFEHFANAVMLKHMSGIHGIHLSVEATVRAVVESYTIGRENFGMEKDFIIEVVQSCPSPACRYYKNHLGITPMPFMDGLNPVPSNQQFSGINAPAVGGEIDLTKSQSHTPSPKLPPPPAQSPHLLSKHHQNQHQKLQQLQQAQQQAAKQQQITAALLQQQNHRALAQQSLEKFNSLSALEKQRVLQQLDPKHFDPMAIAAAAANLQMQGLMQSHHNSTQPSPSPSVPLGGPNNLNMVMPPAGNMAGPQAHPSSSTSSTSGLSHHHVPHHLAHPPPSPTKPPSNSSLSSSSALSMHGPPPTSHLNVGAMAKPIQVPPPPPPATLPSHHLIANEQKSAAELLRSSLEAIESNKDLLALHNGSWNSSANFDNMNRSNDVDMLPVGQDKIVRVFAELMRNMARMKTYIRPAMCKPYGKQSESLQKTLMDTIQIVQTLRNCLPAPHIPVTSWKSENEGTPGLSTSANNLHTNNLSNSASMMCSNNNGTNNLTGMPPCSVSQSISSSAAASMLASARMDNMGN